MCFSLQASGFMFLLGVISSVWGYYKLNWKISVSIGYFTIMQIIHILGYLTIDKCDNIYNQLASRLNYIHICFQSFFIILGHYGIMEYTKNIDRDSKTRVIYALYITFTLGIFLLFRLVDNLFNGQRLSNKKTSSCIWCGDTCSFKGEKHINFQLPLLKTNYYIPSIFAHFIGFFIIPLFINKLVAILTIILAITTFVPAYFLNIKNSEAGTIWCFYSITQILLILFISFYYKK